MNAENKDKTDFQPTLKGLTSLAECELKFIKIAENKDKIGNRLKIACLVNDLERIEKLAELNNITLNDRIVENIYREILKHPDRNEIIKNDVNSRS
jgi:hypothetical protein